MLRENNIYHVLQNHFPFYWFVLKVQQCYQWNCNVIIEGAILRSQYHHHNVEIVYLKVLVCAKVPISKIAETREDVAVHVEAGVDG